MSFEKFQEALVKTGASIQNNIYVSAISSGLLATLPMMMVSALGSILNQLSIGGWQDFLVSSGLKTFTSLPSNVGNSLMALFVVFTIGYRLARSLGKDGITAGIMSLMAFLFLTPLQYNEMGGLSGIPADWLGASGLFVAMIVGCVVAKVYAWFVDKNIVIKMPEGVPPMIAQSFSAIIPSLAISAGAIAISFAFSKTGFESFHGLIYTVFSAPLAQLSGSFPALVIAVLAAMLFWFVGIHGTTIALSVFMPLWAPLDAMNLAAYNAGQPSASIVCMQFFFLSAFIGGAGNTLSLILNMMNSKVESNRTLAKLAILPALFGINEPIIFGMPIVLNATLAIPFVVSPVVCTVLAYILCSLGILAGPTGISAISGMPVIISQFFQCGWTWAAWTVVAIIISYFIYRPFFKSYEKTQLQEMSEDERNEQAASIAEAFDKATK